MSKTTHTSAPELLAALNVLADAAEGAITSPDDAGYRADCQDAIDAARTLIAKAEGGQ